MLTTNTKRSAAATILAAVALFSSTPLARAFDYTPILDGEDAKQILIDNTTLIEGLQTIFIGDATLVLVDGVEWIKNEELGNSSSSILKWETSVNGVVQDSGEIDMSVYDRELPTSIEAGMIQVDQSKLLLEHKTSAQTTLYPVQPVEILTYAVFFFLSVLIKRANVDCVRYCYDGRRRRDVVHERGVVPNVPVRCNSRPADLDFDIGAYYEGGGNFAILGCVRGRVHHRWVDQRWVQGDLLELYCRRASQ